MYKPHPTPWLSPEPHRHRGDARESGQKRQLEAENTEQRFCGPGLGRWSSEFGLTQVNCLLEQNSLFLRETYQNPESLLQCQYAIKKKND